MTFAFGLGSRSFAPVGWAETPAGYRCLSENRYVRDDELAHLVAADLAKYLSTLAGQETRKIFALAVWAGDDYGNFAVSVGTEEWFDWFRQVPAHRDVPDEQLYGPYYRWWSGNWDTIVLPFLSPGTEELLAPLGAMTCDDSLPVQIQARASRRWREIGYTAVELTALPPALATTDGPLFYVESPDGDCVDVAEQMLRTVTPRHFHAAIPAWRRLASVVRSLPARQRIGAEGAASPTHQSAQGQPATPDADDSEPDVLACLLRACGLEMSDVTKRSERLKRALAIAGRA
jgi:hypothetical protein